MQRRAFLGTALAALASSQSIARAVQPADKKAAAPRDATGVRALGWELGTQAWTFRDRTCFEAIDTARMLGLTCIELYPGQQLTKDSAEIKVGPELTATQRSELKSKLASAGVRAHSFGVVSPSSDEKALRAIFEFARDMGMAGIACEPVMSADDRPGPAWKLVDKLTAEYGLYAACHNHPKPTTYWDPQIVLDVEKNFTNPRVGACADTGHWTRSGLSTVESLRKFQGRIFELHFKDVKDNIDHPWGTGAGEARGQMAELKRQGFKGAIFVEYEHGSGKELEENVRKSIEFFDRTAKELA
ncbi:MAG: hypothetical protein GIKADHBN_01836 [Phycisphaerales bacterium]|nr:hypothetical protein [Phycisphaerales bacterium]MCK6477619.1 sugar phosphate isomerase/epimerase [Phycisphaerales bacterium]